MLKRREFLKMVGGTVVAAALPISIAKSQAESEKPIQYGFSQQTRWYNDKRYIITTAIVKLDARCNLGDVWEVDYGDDWPEEWKYRIVSIEENQDGISKTLHFEPDYYFSGTFS